MLVYKLEQFWLDIRGFTPFVSYYPGYEMKLNYTKFDQIYVINITILKLWSMVRYTYKLLSHSISSGDIQHSRVIEHTFL